MRKEQGPRELKADKVKKKKQVAAFISEDLWRNGEKHDGEERL